MRMAIDSHNSSTMSRSLIINSVRPCSGVFVRMIGIPISMGMIASIPYVIVNGDMPVGLRAVVLYARSTPGSSSIHLPLAESNRFFKAFNRVLLEASAKPLLCG